MARRKKVDGIPTIGMPHVSRLTVVRGPAGCGKTQRLVRDARALLECDIEPSSVLVLCATPDAARAFADRLGAPGVRVSSAREVALELLASPAAVALFGHGPRVLLPFEEDILFEDLKTCGVEPGRIAGMLAFFKRSMTEISDDHPDFLMDDDERAVMGALRQGLQLRGAILEQQVSADAARLLAARPAGDSARFAHVFVDDWQHLSRASQVMAALLAGESLCVATDPAAAWQVLESYPYVHGTEELLAANPQADTVELDGFLGPEEIGRAVNAVRREAGLEPCRLGRDGAGGEATGETGCRAGGAGASVGGASHGDAVEGARKVGGSGAAEGIGRIGHGSTSTDAAGSLKIEVLADAEREVARVAELVHGALGEGLSPSGVYVVSPNGAWSLRIAQALAQKGVAGSIACNWASLAESEADTSSDAGYLKALTAALLAGDPDDDAAWRSWCAFDEPLAASGEIAAIAEIASARGMCLHELLASPGLASQAGRLSDAHHKGATLLELVKGMGKDGLLRTLSDELCGAGEPVPEALRRLCGEADKKDGAATLRAHILKRTANGLGWEPAMPNGSGEADAVRIGPMERMCGLSPKFVVFAGFVNGFFPGHSFFDQTATPPGEAAQAHAVYARKLSCALAKAAGSAAFTAFAKMPCTQAEQLGAKIDRIGLENHVRTARVSPSIFCGYLEGRNQGCR